MSISRIGELFPKYKTHFNFPTDDACVKSMGTTEKHGKILYKFFHDAVSGKQWKTDGDLRKILNCCIAHKDLVSGEYKAKFKSISHVFEKEVKKEKKAPSTTPSHKSEKHKESHHHKHGKKTDKAHKAAPQATVKAPEPINQPPQSRVNVPDFSARFLRPLREDIIPQALSGIPMQSSAYMLVARRATFQYLESSGTPIAQQLLDELYEVGYERFAIAHDLRR